MGVRTRLAVLPAALLGLGVSLFSASQSPELDRLYQSNRWFEFRDAMQRAPNPSAFHKGQLALAFHDWPEAEKQLSSVMRARKDAAEAFESALGLQQIYTLSGRLKDARALLPKIQQMMTSLAIDRSVRKQFEMMRAQLAPLEGYADQQVLSRGRSRLLYSLVDNQLIVPLTVNGAPTNYVLDTGAESCSLSASEAKRLGLQIHPAKIPISAPGADREQTESVAVANDLTIGNFHLRNVVFLVTPDDSFLSDSGGVIGLPVLLALETLRWSSDGTIEFGFSQAPRNGSRANLALAGAVLANLSVEGRPLTAVFDTGAYATHLLPEFASTFPEFAGHPLSIEKRQVGNGAEDPRVATIPDLRVRVGGLETLLSPARILSSDPIDDARDTQAWLGMDLLGQARSVTIDFTSMTLALDGIDESARPVSGDCALPPDFLCAPGMRCTAKAETGEACYVDRTPVSPPPGNAIAGNPADGPHCVFEDHAVCPPGNLCRVPMDEGPTCRIRSEPAPTAARPLAVIPTPKAAETKSAAPNAKKALEFTDADARAAVQRGVKFESLDLDPARDYIYVEDQVTRQLGPDGSVKETSSQTHEVMNLYDGTFERLIKKNGKNLPPDKARAEQAKFDKAVDKRAHESPDAKAKRLEAKRKADAADLACSEEFMTLFQFRAAGEEQVRGRPAWMVELDPLANVAPRCGYLKPLSRFRIKIWIDQAEFRWVRWEADNIASVTWAKFRLRVPAQGAHITFSNQRHEDGSWLLSNLEVKMNAKALLFAPLRFDVEYAYSGYRKFQADSRLVSADGK